MCWSAWTFPSRSSSGRRAQDQGRPGKDGLALGKAWRRKTRPSAVDDRSTSPGRPSSKGMGELHLDIHRRPHEAGVQGRGQCRQAAGGLPRDHLAEAAEHRLQVSQADRRFVVSTLASRCEIEPPEPAGLRVRESSGRWAMSQGVHPGSRQRVCVRARWIESVCLAGFPMVDVQVTLYDGSYHEVDSSEMAFEILQVPSALERGCKKAGRCCWSRFMKVEVVTPGRLHGRRSIGDLNSRRGSYPGYGRCAINAKVIKAEVPLAEMFGYVTDLRSMQRRAGPATRCSSPSTLRRE